jgi:hypothetical protein
VTCLEKFFVVCYNDIAPQINSLRNIATEWQGRTSKKAAEMLLHFKTF